jgi:hypothetical protein
MPTIHRRVGPLARTLRRGQCRCAPLDAIVAVALTHEIVMKGAKESE